ncbi:MAG TPA: WD40 repeat domain-containing protein [Gemmataceae bacterium]|nr:WD40 repeat domain-containing protein [Gemmataceae bacterium]
MRAALLIRVIRAIRGLTVLACLTTIVPATYQQKLQPAITALAVAPDDKLILVGSQAGVAIRGIKSKDSQSLAVKLDHVLCLAFSPDGKTLAIGGGRPAEAGIIELWSWPEKKLLGQLEGHGDLVHDVAWLADGKMLASASADRTVRVWDVASKKSTLTLSGHSGPVLCLAAFADGKTLCSGSADQTIRVWNAADGKLVRSLDNHLGAVHALAIRPGRAKEEPVTLASASADATVRIWQPALGRLVRIVRQPSAFYGVVWNQDGSLLACGGKDGVLRIVDGDSDKVLSERMLSKGWIVSLARASQIDALIVGTTLGEVQSAALAIDKK